MISKMYLIWDAKTEAFLCPFFQPNDATAKRMFSDCVNDPAHQFSRHPEDYSLHFAGEFNDNTGDFGLQNPISLIGYASVFKVKEPD